MINLVVVVDDTLVVSVQIVRVINVVDSAAPKMINYPQSLRKLSLSHVFFTHKLQCPKLYPSVDQQ